VAVYRGIAVYKGIHYGYDQILNDKFERIYGMQAVRSKFPSWKGIQHPGLRYVKDEAKELSQGVYTNALMESPRDLVCFLLCA